MKKNMQALEINCNNVEQGISVEDHVIKAFSPASGAVAIAIRQDGVSLDINLSEAAANKLIQQIKVALVNSAVRDFRLENYE